MIRLIPLNEIYFGENIVTDRIVDIIDKMQHTKIDLKSKNSEAAKLIRDLCDALEDFSGAKRVEIDIDEDAMCYTIPAPYKKRPAFFVTKEGIRFKKNEDVMILITANPTFLFSRNGKTAYTPREITAMLIHEIGHNFSQSILPIYDIIASIKIALRVKNNITRNGDKLSNSDKEDINTLKETIMKVCGNISDKATTLINSIKIMISSKLASLATVHTGAYADEVIADSFATMYGFGKDLGSGLIKLEDKIIKPIDKSLGFMGILFGALFTGILILYDEHPSDITRLYKIVNQLEYELKTDKNLLPEDRKQIQKDIIGIKALMVQMKTINSDDRYNIPKKIYYKVLSALFGGEEIFSILTNNLINAKIIDKAIRKE